MASPARSQFVDVAGYSNSGNFQLVTTTRVTVYVAVPYAGSPQTTLAQIYSAETGAGTPGNPFNATTGEINFWASPGSYDIKIEDTGTPAKFATKVVRWDAMPGDEGVLGAMLTDGQVDLTKLAAAVQQLLVPTGAVLPFAGPSAPSTFLLCDGSAVSRSTYSALYALVGTTFGAGDGASTFNVPDLRGRVPVGVDGAAGRLSSVPDTLGQSGGEERHALTIAELPSHTHALDARYGYTPAGSAGQGIEAQAGGGTNGGQATQATGSGTAHNVMQPFQVVNYIIKT